MQLVGVLLRLSSFWGILKIFLYMLTREVFVSLARTAFEQPMSLYIHWPFCPYKCSFCPFVAFSGWDRFMVQYHQALNRELMEYGKNFDFLRPLSNCFMFQNGKVRSGKCCKKSVLEISFAIFSSC